LRDHGIRENSFGVLLGTGSAGLGSTHKENIERWLGSNSEFREKSSVSREKGGLSRKGSRHRERAGRTPGKKRIVSDKKTYLRDLVRRAFGGVKREFKPAPSDPGEKAQKIQFRGRETIGGQINMQGRSQIAGTKKKPVILRTGTRTKRQI